MCKTKKQKNELIKMKIKKKTKQNKKSYNKTKKQKKYPRKKRECMNVMNASLNF